MVVLVEVLLVVFTRSTPGEAYFVGVIPGGGGAKAMWPAIE